MNEIWEVFIQQLLATTWLEAIAVFFGLLSVWFSKQENIWVYPTGIISVLIYVYITFVYKLYADMGVNSYYFIMSVYGWYHWTNTSSNIDQIPISRNNKKESLVSFAIMIVGFGLIRFSLQFTDSDVPNLDALTTASAITAMWLMARKKIENWLFWIITDIIAIPLYIYKGLPLTSFQYLVFTILAISGYYSWRRKVA